MNILSLCAALATMLAPAAAWACPDVGEGSPSALHQEWIMEGWEREPGDPDFVFAQKMARYYDIETPEGIFFDNFAPGDTQLFDDASIYGANWEGLQNAARSVLHGLTGGEDAIIGDGVASTTLGFVGQIDRLDGEVIAFDGRSQLGWVCTEGAWKIRQELNYAEIVDPEEIAGVIGSYGPQQ